MPRRPCGSASTTGSSRALACCRKPAGSPSSWPAGRRTRSGSRRTRSIARPIWISPPHSRLKRRRRPSACAAPTSVKPTTPSRRSASPNSSDVSDSTVVSAFLTESHVALAGRITAYAAREIAPLPEPADDAAARAQARDLVARLGRAGWVASIGDLDLPRACPVLETVAGPSPLADAAFRLQALGPVPILLAGAAPLKERWLPPVLAGAGHPAFAE